MLDVIENMDVVICECLFVDLMYVNQVYKDG